MNNTVYGNQAKDLRGSRLLVNGHPDETIGIPENLLIRYIVGNATSNSSAITKAPEKLDQRKEISVDNFNLWLGFVSDKM